MKVNSSDSTMAISMRSVVRAAYPGRFAGSSETGWRCSSVNGCNRCRLASARNTNSPRIKRTARTSQRVKKRPHPPTEIGTFSRMSAMPDLRWSLSHRRH